MEESNFNLRFDNHLIFLKAELKNFTSKPIFSDVTLACRGTLFPTHRLILACCSPYFKHVLEETPGDNAIIVLNDLYPNEVASLIQFMYCGEVDVKKQNLERFFQAAKYLDIKPLTKGMVNLDSDEDIEKLLPEKEKDTSVTIGDSSNSIHSNGIDDQISSLKISPDVYHFDEKSLPNAIWSQSHIKTESPFSEPQSCHESQTSPAVNGDGPTNGRLMPAVQPLVALQSHDDEPHIKEESKRKFDALEDALRDDDPAEYSPESSAYDSQFENESIDNNATPYVPHWEKPGNSMASTHPDAICSNCGTHNTKLWRRSSSGDMVCNACGLYHKLHSCKRPKHLFRETPMTRRRNPRKKRYGDGPMDIEQHQNAMSNGDQEYLPEIINGNHDARDNDVINAAIALQMFMKSQPTASTARFHDPSGQAGSPLWMTGAGLPTIIPQLPINARMEARPPPPPLLMMPALQNGSSPQERKIVSVARHADQRSDAEINGLVLARENGNLN